MQIVGLDIGTTSLCGVAVDADSGAVIRTITRPDNPFFSGRPVWAREQDPRYLTKTAADIACQLLAEGETAALGVTGQMHGLVYLDREGNPVSPLITWQDGRGDQPYQNGQTYAEYLTERTGYPMATGYGAVTHFYNTVNGLVPEKAVTFCTIHDLAAMTLSGRTSPLLDASDAASLGLYDLEKNEFDRAAIEAAGMDASFFPAVAPGFSLTGKTPKGVPVSAAIGDNQASVLGALSDPAHSILINVGTGSQISCVVNAPQRGDGLDCRPLTPGRWLLAGSALCGGRAYAILEKFLREAASVVGGVALESAYPAMEQLLKTAPAPAAPLTVDTRFSGTRSQPWLRGSIGNIGEDNFTVANLCNGVLKGMVTELHELYREMQPYLASKPTRLVGAGNGLRLNAPLAARFSEAFGLPLFLPVHGEEAAFGAALFAMTAAGAVPSLEEAQKRIRFQPCCPSATAD